MRKTALIPAILVAALPCISLAQAAGDTAYNKAIMRAQTLDKLGDALVTNAQIAIEGDDAKEACSALNDTVLNWRNALVSYQAARDAPADSRDTDRLTTAAIDDETAFIHQKIDKGQSIIDAYCK